MTKRNLLLVLDMNGTLMTRSEFVKADHTPRTSTPRPGLTEFLTRMLENFHVAIYSSTMYANVDHAIVQTFSGMEEQMEFVWGREYTITDVNHKDPSTMHDTVKDLNVIWKSSDHWKINNTILIDDTESKGRLCSDNLLLVPEFTHHTAPDDDFLMRLGDVLLEEFTLEQFPPIDSDEAEGLKYAFFGRSELLANPNGKCFQRKYKVVHFDDLNPNVPGDVRGHLERMSIKCGSSCEPKMN